MENLLTGKNALIIGVANKRSIAWGIAQSLHQAGANLILTYQIERFREDVEKLAGTFSERVQVIGPCDVQNDAEMETIFTRTGEIFDGKLDVFVHGAAFAKREELQKDFNFVNTSREGFLLAQDISAFSLIDCTRRALPMLLKAGGGSVMTLTYLGAERVVTNYNVMGVAKASLEAAVRYLAAHIGPQNIRVNAISAGPIRTTSSSGISGINDMRSMVREQSPLRRDTDQAEVGDTALFLASNLSRGITGEVIHVDSGYHILGIASAD